MMLDTLVLVPFGHCRRYSDLRDIRDLEVAHDRGSRRKHFIRGLTFGAIGGALAGFLIAGDGCSQSPCDDGGLAVVEFSFGGAVTGGVTGGVVGILLPAGTYWKAVPRQLVRLDGR